jgi:putative salt-induced outer membrane protein YdiY
MRNKLTLTLLMAATLPAHAIVSMEGLHTLKATAGFSGQIDLSLQGSDGSSKKRDYTVASRLQWHRPAEWTRFIVINGSYGEVNDIKNSDRAFLHLRHIQPIYNNIDLEGYAQIGHNRFTRIKQRSLGGAGGRFTLHDSTDQGLIIFGLGAFYSQDKFDNRIASDAGNHSLWRGNTYLVAKYRLSPNAQLSNTLYWQPALSDRDDYQLIDELALSVAVTNSANIAITANYSHNSRPPVGINQGDFTFKTTLGYRF